MKVENLARKLSCMFIGVSAVMAAGCGGLGNGVLPVSAVILPLGGLEGAATAKAYNCLNTSLTYIITFSNGARGDFTSRSTYTSSDPTVAKISNGDVLVPGQTALFYPRGTIVPANSGIGATRITAKYLSFTTFIDVTVSAPQNFHIEPTSADLAAQSTLDLAVFADLGGVKTPLDSVVTWAIVTPDTTIATINSGTGTLTGVAASPTVLVAKPTLLGCTSLSTQANVTVDTLNTLALTKEFASGDLVVGTTERLTATGTLVNGKTQDLSNQVVYTSTHPSDPPADPAITTKALTFFSGSLSNLAVAIRAVTTPVQVGASFVYPTATSPAVTPSPVVASSIGITPIAATLNSIAITPDTKTVLAGEITQFNATGTYAGGATQDISRHVGWTSSNVGQASIQTSTSTLVNGLAGQATTAGSAAGKVVTITATNAAATAGTTTTATLTIN